MYHESYRERERARERQTDTERQREKTDRQTEMETRRLTARANITKVIQHRLLQKSMLDTIFITPLIDDCS